MKQRPWLGLTLALALAACAAPAPLAPTHPPAAMHLEPPGADDAARAKLGLPPDGQLYPEGNRYRVLQVDELPLVGVAVDSQASGFPRDRLMDGNLGTEWVNGGYRNATAWAAVELAESASLASVDIKTGPTAQGASYALQVSEDGATWKTVASNLTNTTWGLENKPLPAGTRGKFVRVFWRNSGTSPAAHFSIFELVVNGEAGGVSPTPTRVPTPTPKPTPSATPTPPPTGELRALRPVSVSHGPSYAGLAAGRAIDGNLSTQWANGGYQEPETFFQLNYDRAWAFGELRIKTGALPSGCVYRLEVSDDSVNWRGASGDLTNTTWNFERKPLAATGRYLRIRFFNRPSNPIARFSIFEVEAWGQATGGANHAPQIRSIVQDRLRNPEFLSAAADDDDGDALSYTWRRHDGTLLGAGARVAYTWSGENAQASGHLNDEPITLTVSDGRGGEASETYLVDNMSGTTGEVQASTPILWDASRTAYAAIAGDVSISTSGEFAIYSGVLVEYTTQGGRRLHVATPGTSTISGVTGNVFMYLLGPSDAGAARPNISVVLGNGRQTVSRTITVENVAGYHHQGQELFLGPGDPESIAGESTARNGEWPYREALWIQSYGYLSKSDYGVEPDTEGDFPTNGRIIYRLIRYGDRFYGADHRLAHGNFGIWIGFTDSLGGESDNSGFMRYYQPYSE